VRGAGTVVGRTSRGRGFQTTVCCAQRADVALVSRREDVEIPEKECIQIQANLSKQKRMNRRILETSEEIDPLNARAPDFLMDLNRKSMLIAMVAIDRLASAVESWRQAKS
jgi:hypothetical protein